MERAPTGSRWGARLVAAVSAGLIVLVPATLFLVADTGTAAALLTGAAVLVAVVALLVAHQGTLAVRSAALATAGEAPLARLDATAPAVSLRLCDATSFREDGGHLRLEATLEFTNHASVPAVVHVGPPSVGRLRERGRQPSLPGATRPVRPTDRPAPSTATAGR